MSFVVGDINAQIHYRFSLYGKFNPNRDLHIEKEGSFVNTVCKSHLTYSISGFSIVDVNSAKKGNPAIGGLKTINLPPSKIKAKAKGYYVNFEPYLKATYEMATFNSSTHQNPESRGVDTITLSYTFFSKMSSLGASW